MILTCLLIALAVGTESCASKVSTYSHRYRDSEMNYFLGSQVNGSLIVFGLPRTFTLKHSRTRDEYYFKSTTTSDISVTFAAAPPKRVLTGFLDQILSSPKHRGGGNPKQIVFSWSVKDIKGHSTFDYLGIGLWQRENSLAGVELRSNDSEASIERDLQRVLKTIYVSKDGSEIHRRLKLGDRFRRLPTLPER